MSSMPVHVPPAPTNREDAERWEHTRRRRRMLYGRWMTDLEDELRRRVGSVRADAWGTPDLSANPFRKAAGGRATLYDRPWTIEHDDAAAAVVLSRHLDMAGAIPLLQRLQRDTLGLREMLLDVQGVTRPDGSYDVLLRPVYPDLVVGVPDPLQPDQPIELREYRIRTVGREPQWVVDVYRVGQPMKVETIRGDELRGLGDGREGIPHVLYHAAMTGALWDPFEEQELYWGTLSVAVQWTFYLHVLQDASWPQRYSIDVAWGPASPEGTGAAARSAIVTDPSTVLQGTRREIETQPIVGQWQSGGNPTEIAQGIQGYERRMAAYLDLDPADAARVSGDPRSGYALEISATAKQAAQQRYAPVFRFADERLCERVAEELNRVGNLGLPLDGWRVRYWFEEDEAPELEETAAMDEAAPEVEEPADAEEMTTETAPDGVEESDT